MRDEQETLMSAYSDARMAIRGILLDAAEEALEALEITPILRTGGGRVPKVRMVMTTLVVIPHPDCVMTMRRQEIDVTIEAAEIMKHGSQAAVGLLQKTLSAKIDEDTFRLDPSQALKDRLEDAAMEAVLKDMVSRLRRRPGPFLEKMREELDRIAVRSVNEG